MSDYPSTIAQILETIKIEAEPPPPPSRPHPKNYSKVNWQRIRKIQSAKSMENLAVSAVPRPPSRKYAEVPSKFRNTIQRLGEPPKDPDKSKLIPSKFQNYGKVPTYLVARKQQWRKEEEERLKNLPDPTIPPGHTCLSEEERLETLQLLRKNQQEILKQLAALPLTSRTLKQKQAQEALEAQLDKVEEGITIFSRSRVLVKNDDNS